MTSTVAPNVTSQQQPGLEGVSLSKGAPLVRSRCGEEDERMRVEHRDDDNQDISSPEINLSLAPSGWMTEDNYGYGRWRQSAPLCG